jgi:hypothetical protein
MKNFHLRQTVKMGPVAIFALAAAMALTSCEKDDPVPPVPVVTITTQPTAPAALTEGSITGALTVAATATEGAKLTYQWYGNTTASNAGGSVVSGATGASYTLPTDLTAGTYHYFCEVGAGGAKPVRSAVATVTVNQKATDPGNLMEVIVFGVNSGGGNKLVAMKPDGSDKRIIYDGAGAEYNFNRIVLHPEGKKAVVMDDLYNIYVYDLAAETAVKIVDVTGGTYPDEAVWHPDGETILFTEQDVDGVYRATSIKPDGTGKTVLTPEGWSLYRANYTPDGSKIVAREDADLGYIATFDANGNNPVKILEAAPGTMFDCHYPVGNDRIFYFSITDWVYSLCTAGIDGSNPETLETFDDKWEIADYICTNADGTLITYRLMGFDEEPVNLFVVRELNGTSLGETIFSSDATNYIRTKFGFIDSDIFESLPEFTHIDALP